MVTKLDISRIKGYSTLLFDNLFDTAFGYEYKLRIRIHKPANQPGTRHPVDVHM